MGIKGFKVGRYYRWVGPKIISRKKTPREWSNWNEKGKMNFILDGKPHLCVSVRDDTDVAADFEHHERDKKNGDGWYWKQYLRYFEDVTLDMEKNLEFIKGL